MSMSIFLPFKIISNAPQDVLSHFARHMPHVLVERKGDDVRVTPDKEHPIPLAHLAPLVSLGVIFNSSYFSGLTSEIHKIAKEQAAAAAKMAQRGRMSTIGAPARKGP